MASLIEKLHAIHHSLTEANLRHAFGGAIALAFCTEEPRGTRDLDINIFTDAAKAADAVSALPSEVAHRPEDIARIVRDGQTRLWWDDTPLDLFLNNHPFHEEVANSIRWVPLAGEEIPILSTESLVIFKALFDRTKDWADIEAIAQVDPQAITRSAETLRNLGADPELIDRLLALSTPT